MTLRLIASSSAVTSVILGALWARDSLLGRSVSLAGGERGERLRAALGRAANEGQIDQSFGGRRLLALSVAAGVVIGFSLLGLVGAPIGAIAFPVALRSAVRARRARHAARIDLCAADFAQSLASALAAGRSVRGALLSSAAATPQPLAAEVDRAIVDMTMGGSVQDALAALRWRTQSARLESLAGAIELHRGSGGDLVKLMRELAEAFRDRDRALRDAHAASAQARFTAYIVAAIPLLVLVLLELAAPGSVSGAISFLPTAVMLGAAGSLLAVGVVLARRIAAVKA